MYYKMTLQKKVRKFFRLVFLRFAYPPNDITIELSTTCELNCRVCFRFPLAVAQKTMKWEVFKDILDKIKAEAGQNIAYLNFVGLGEVFCQDQLLKMLTYTRELFGDISINISTSLVPFREDVLRQLLDKSLVDQINISLDDVQPCSPDFHPCTDETRRHICRLLEMARAQRPGLAVRLQSILQSQEQVARILQFAQKNDISRVHFIRMDVHAFNGPTRPARAGLRQEKQWMKWARRQGKKWKITVTHNNSFNVFMRIASHFDKYCLMSDDHMFIDVDGHVLPCFFLRKHVFGNLRQESLRQIYRKAKKRSFYADQREVCAGCDEYKEHYHHASC